MNKPSETPMAGEPLFDMSEICPKCGTGHLRVPLSATWPHAGSCRKCGAVMPVPQEFLDTLKAADAARREEG